MYEFLRNLFASEQPVMERFNVVDPTAVGNNVRSISLAYTPTTAESSTAVVSLFWTDSKNKVYEKQFQDELQAQNLFGAMKSDLQEAADLTRTEKMESAASLVRSLLKRYAIYTDELVDGNPAPITNTNADLKLSKIQNPLVNKNAKVVMQNLFFETPEELQKYQDMNKKNNPGAGKQLGDFKDDLPPLDKNKAPGQGMDDEMGEGEDGLAPSSLSYEDYEKNKAQEQKSLSKRIEREVKDQVQSALERKIASTFDGTDDELIEAMRKKGRTWDEIKNYYIKNLQYDKESVAAFIDALRESEEGVAPGTEPKLDAPMGDAPVKEKPSAPKPPEDLVSPETHDKLVKEIDDKNPAAPMPEEHEIEKHDMVMGEIASQSIEINKVADEPLETIPKSRPQMGKDFDFLPDETEMSDDMKDDPAAAPDPGDITDVNEEVLIPSPDTKVYVMKDYQSGDGGYEGTLVSKYTSGGEEWGVVDSNGDMKEVPMRDIKRASIFRRLVKQAMERKRKREEEKTVNAQAELKAILAGIKQVDEELKKEADSSVVMPMLYAIRDKDILDYANGSIYANKIASGQMSDEDWQTLVKETGRWMPHVGRDKTSQHFPQNAEWHFDAEQIGKIKNMFQNLPTESALKTADKAHYHSCPTCETKFGKECGCGHPKVNMDVCSKCHDKDASLKTASGCSVKDCTNPVEETLKGKPYCKKHLWGIDPNKKEAGLKCPNCGSTESVTPGFGHKLNKCDACHFAFDTDEDDNEKQAAPGDVKPALSPADPKALPETKVKGPELDEPWKKAPEGLRDEKAVLAPQEVQDLYNQVKDTEIKIQKIKTATDEIMKKAAEDVRKFKDKGNSQALAEQYQKGVQQLYAALDALNAKVVEVDTTLLAFVKEQGREDIKWTAAEKLKKVIEKFPEVEKYLENALNGAQSQAQNVEKQMIIPFPKKTNQLSRFDKRADLIDTLNYILENINAAVAALSGTESAPQPALG